MRLDCDSHGEVRWSDYNRVSHRHLDGLALMRVLGGQALGHMHGLTLSHLGIQLKHFRLNFEA